MILLNFGVLLVYTLLYFLFSDEPGEGFPVQWAVYFSVHGIGLCIMSVSQRAIRNRQMANACLASGSLILSLGWMFTFVVFML
jgi:hypothetical protein